MIESELSLGLDGSYEHDSSPISAGTPGKITLEKCEPEEECKVESTKTKSQFAKTQSDKVVSNRQEVREFPQQ